MKIPIRLYGDECLKEEAWDVEIDGDNYVELVHDLFDTLKVSRTGVGLASTQIGVPLRVFVAIHGDLKSEFINPVIISTGDTKVTEEEGCLSIPTITVNVERYRDITVDRIVAEYPDIFAGKNKIYTAGGSEIYR